MFCLLMKALKGKQQGDGLGGGYLIGVCSSDLDKFDCSPDVGWR